MSETTDRLRVITMNVRTAIAERDDINRTLQGQAHGLYEALMQPGVLQMLLRSELRELKDKLREYNAQTGRWRY